MGNFSESKLAVSSVVGVIFMVGLTVILVGTAATSVFVYPMPLAAPDANIVMREARGNDGTLTGNEIVLAHKGGDTLRSDRIRIIINGEGKEALKIDGIDIGSALIGDITITYSNLEGYNYVNSDGRRKDRWKYNLTGGNNTHIEDAKIVHNDKWTPGETIVLFGADGRSHNDINNVDKRYELTPGSKVIVTIIDIPTGQIISASFTTVKYSDQVVGY